MSPQPEAEPEPTTVLLVAVQRVSEGDDPAYALHVQQGMSRVTDHQASIEGLSTLLDALRAELAALTAMGN